MKREAQIKFIAGMLSGWMGFAERTAGGKKAPNKAEKEILKAFGEHVMVAYDIAEESFDKLAKRSAA